MARTTDIQVALISLVGAILLLCGSASGIGLFTDDFEDGIIDVTQWAYGGAKRGPYSWSPVGEGSWTFSHDEVVAADGYARMWVQGPTSGNSYGAEAWIRTVHNYNDGGCYTMNFTWGAAVRDGWYNHYFVQITDGYIPDPGSHIWYVELNPVPGTANLLRELPPNESYPCRALPDGLSKTTWSITIDPSSVASLYDGPSGTGALMRAEPLDPSYAWHVRFMVADATSAGHPAGDIELDLYRFEVVPEPATLSLLALGGLALVRRRR